jgi:hypothetical protein
MTSWFTYILIGIVMDIFPKFPSEKTSWIKMVFWETSITTDGNEDSK